MSDAVSPHTLIQITDDLYISPLFIQELTFGADESMTITLQGRDPIHVSEEDSAHLFLELVRRGYLEADIPELEVAEFDFTGEVGDE